ncbi:MAG TPA: efflux RND transporter periplasmic adaptor subunit [Thermoanaerobaculia bacterium]|nr:efflux RND transporter periplasmic adaptor subunit [Thermoanaerobaculia bacterium]
MRTFFSLLIVVAGLVPVRCSPSADARVAQERLVVRRGDFVSNVLLTGELEAARAEVLTVPRVPSWQTSIKWIAEDGVAVKAGEKVIELDNSEFASSLEQTRASERQALQEVSQKDAETGADLARRELDLESRELELERAAIDAEVPKEIVPLRDYQDRQLALEKAERELAKARKDLDAARTAARAERDNLLLDLDKARQEIARAERAIEELTLRAPRDGIFLIGEHPWEGRPLQQGDMAFVGMPLAKIPDLDSIQVAAALPDVDDGLVRKGMSATAFIDAFPDLSFAATIEDVAPVAREQGSQSLRRFFNVTASLAGIDREIMRPGYSVRMNVERSVQKNQLLIPRAALDLSSTPPRARLAGGRIVDVTLGECNAQECILRGGLEGGAELSRFTRAGEETTP